MRDFGAIIKDFSPKFCYFRISFLKKKFFGRGGGASGGGAAAVGIRIADGDIGGPQHDRRGREN